MNRTKILMIFLIMTPLFSAGGGGEVPVPDESEQSKGSSARLINEIGKEFHSALGLSDDAIFLETLDLLEGLHPVDEALVPLTRIRNIAESDGLEVTTIRREVSFFFETLQSWKSPEALLFIVRSLIPELPATLKGHLLLLIGEAICNRKKSALHTFFSGLFSEEAEAEREELLRRLAGEVPGFSGEDFTLFNSAVVAYRAEQKAKEEDDDTDTGPDSLEGNASSTTPETPVPDVPGVADGPGPLDLNQQ